MSDRWTCHVCSSVNDAGAIRCAACGFAAVASGREVERAVRDRANTVKVETSKATGVGEGPSTPKPESKRPASEQLLQALDVTRLP